MPIPSFMKESNRYHVFSAMQITIFTISERKRAEFRATAATMLAEGTNIMSHKGDFFVLRHDSPEYHERIKEDEACIFYTFGHEGVTFHVTFY